MRFNTIKKKNVKKIKNHEGADAYLLSQEMALYTLAVTSPLQDKFYEKADKQVQRLRELIALNDPEFVAKLAIYTREKMYLRSIPLVMVVELAKIHNGDDLLCRLAARVIQRADEITELLAYYQMANERKATKKLNKLSKQLQRGLALAFNKFDEYQFAKYNRQTEVKLKDALFLVHPKAKDADQQQIFDKIVKDSLEIPYTWEVELSALGQQAFESELERKKAFKTKWQELIQSGKLGYMALMRNLRNIVQAEVDVINMKQVVQRLSDPLQVARSKQLPFRFLSAYRELQKVSSVYTKLITKALEDAIVTSTANLKGFDESTKVLIACDTSGSMCSPVSPRSTIQYYDIGLLLGMLLQTRCKAVMTGIFGDTWKLINLPSDNVLSNVDYLRKRMGEVGYSTNGYLVIRDLIKRKIKMDKVMIFTDMQLWDNRYANNNLASEWEKYRQIAPEAKLYLFDLAGYGQAPLQIKEGNVYLIAGWSDKVFDILDAIEKGKSTLSKIQEVKI